MYIVDENYRQFYFGTGVEYFFISQFYMMGVEAYKLNPDIGYDICVTNKGNARFKGDKSIDYFVQVKSAILVKNKTCFWIKKEDFEILMNDDKAVLICGMYKPIMRADPNSFYYNRDSYHSDQMFKCIDQEAMENFIDKYHKFTAKDKEEQFKFVDFDFCYFWLNNVHLKRLINEGFIEKKDSNGNEYYIINVELEYQQDEEVEKPVKGLNYRKSELNDEKRNIKLKNTSEDTLKETNPHFVPYLVLELRSIFYLINKCQSTEELNKGSMFFSDNSAYK